MSASPEGAGLVCGTATRRTALGFPTLWDIGEEHGRSNPHVTAVVCGPKRLTYPSLLERVSKVAATLTNFGVGRGDRVLWWGRNCHLILELLMAASRVGCVVCIANWRWTPEELEFVIGDLDPALVVERPSGRSEGDESWTLSDRVRGQLLSAEGLEESSKPAEVPHGSAADALLVLYTAAYSGEPNGALFTGTALIVQSVQWALARGIDNTYRYLSCGPLFHVATMGPMLATFFMGGMNVFVPDADPTGICDAIDHERCNGAFVIEPTISKIIELNRGGQFDLRSLRAPSGRPEWDSMITVEPGGMLDYYGLTEGGGIVTSWQRGGIGVHGRSMPLAELQIVGFDGLEVVPGSIGNICVRGPGVMSGYLNRPTFAATIRDGWMPTGDLGRREVDGSITFVGSSRRLIKSGNENIYPIEVELCLAAHPAVAGVAVIGVPDPVWTQRVKAVVSSVPGSDATADELIEHCRRHLASYKKPRIVEFVEALPKVDGQVDYAEVNRRYGGGGYPGGD